MTRREHLAAFAAGMAGAFVVANAIVVGAILVEHRRHCRSR